MTLLMPSMDQHRRGPIGRYRDRLVQAGHSPLDFGWTHNLIVERCRVLLAALVKGDPGGGIQEIHIGRGEAAWDEDGPPPAAADTEALVDANPVVIPIAPDAITFLDATGASAETPSPHLEVTVELGAGVPAPDPGGTFPLREFGLFSQLGDEIAMIDYVRHPVIHKGPDDTLTRTIRLHF